MRTKDSKNSTSSFRAAFFRCLEVFVAVAWVVSLIIFVSGCGAGKIPPVKTYVQAKKEVAAKGPLVTPPVEKREGLPEGKSQAVKKDAPVPFSGILLDEKKATRLAAIKAERDRRRKELQASREKAEIQKLVYESTISNLRAELRARQTWWEQNKGLVGLLTGTVLGMAIVTGLVYALTKGSGATATTNPHVLPKLHPAFP